MSARLWRRKATVARRAPATRTWLDGATRIAALVVFALAIYGLGYRPSGRADRYIDVTAQLAETIRAANDGLPFATYSDRVPAGVVRIDQFASGYYDPGLPVLISATALAGRATFGEQFKVGKRTIYRIVFGLCLLAALVAACPALPLPVSLGALTALGTSILVAALGFDAFFWPKWWEAYSAFLVGMLVVGLIVARENRWRPCFFAAAIVLIAYSRLLRDEAFITAAAALGGLTATLLVLWLVARGWVRSPPAAAAIWPLLRRSVLVSAACCLGLMAVPYLLRVAIATAWNIPVAETVKAVHGTGHSLYLSLGYVPNPYNISWRDNVAMSHSHLIDPAVRVEDARYQEVLKGEALRIIVDSPWLLLSNVAERTRATLGYLKTSRALSVAAMSAALATALSLALVLWCRRPRLLALWAGLLGLGAGASAPALLIHPLYSNGLQGFVLLLAFVAPPAMLAVFRSGETPPNASARDLVDQSTGITARALVVFVLAAAAVGAAAGGWYAIRAFRYATERAAIAASPDPLADLERQGYRYAGYFNDLPTMEQERLIAAMSATHTRGLAVPFPPTAVDGFRPVLVASTNRQLHVIAWLGRERHAAGLPPEMSHTFIGYCAWCEHMREELPNDPYALDDAHVRLDVAGIHNRAWTDRYQLLSIPIDAARLAPGEIRLALQPIADVPAVFTIPLTTTGQWRARVR